MVELAAESEAVRMSEPRIVSATVSRSQKGNVALKEYGKLTSGYDVFFSRSFEIPEDWTQAQVDEFQLQQQDHLRELIDPIDQAEYDTRVEQADPGIH